jgi:hypothetical protein
LVAIAVAFVLWSQLLLFDAASYPIDFGGVSLYSMAPIAGIAAGFAFGVGIALLAWRRSTWTWLAAAAAIPLAVPRIWLPDVAYVATVVGRLDRTSRRQGHSRR